MSLEELDPLGHLGELLPLIEQAREIARKQSMVAGFSVASYGVVEHRVGTKRPEVIVFGVDAAGRDFALRFEPDEASAFGAKVLAKVNLCRGLPEEGLAPQQAIERQVGALCVNLFKTVPGMPVDAGYFEVPYGEHTFGITVRVKKGDEPAVGAPTAGT